MCSVETHLNSMNQTWQAELDLVFTRAEQDKTILSKKKHQGPLLVQKTLYPEGADICHVAILHPPAGIAGGDHLAIQIHLEDHAKSVICTPGATKWYKSNGKLSSQCIDIQVDAKAHLDFLPQENIFFNQANAHSEIKIRQAKNSSLIAWDMSQLGRTASGEQWSAAQLNLKTEFWLDDKLIWVESGCLSSEDPKRAQAYGLAGFGVMGTMWLSSTSASQEMAHELAQSLPWTSELRAGVTHFSVTPEHGLIVLRGLAHEVEDLKNLFIQTWLNLRQSVADIPATPLRLWRT